MSRVYLFGTVAVAALLVTGTSQAQVIYGGGSTLGGPVYISKVFPDAKIATQVANGTTTPAINYYNVGSGTGICAFVDNTAAGVASGSGSIETCSSYASKLSGNDNPPALPPSGATISFGASDAAITSTNVSDFASNTGGHQIIQVPAFGTPVTIPFHLSGKTTNGSLALTDADLCGIFSGKYTNWSQVSSKPNSNPITVVYRADSSGTTFLLTNHLSAVCSSGFSPTTSFASLFSGGVPSNFVGATGSSGVATAVAADNNSVGYVGPDYTLETKASCGGSGQPACSPVASVVNSSNVGGLPTTNNTTLALASAKFTVSATNPLSFDPYTSYAKPSTGYPIVGYTNVLFSSAYKSQNQVNLVYGWADCLYNASGKTCPTIATDLNAFGFVPVPGVTGSSAPAGTSLAGQIITAYFAGTPTNPQGTVKIVVSSTGR